MNDTFPSEISFGTLAPDATAAPPPQAPASSAGAGPVSLGWLIERNVPIHWSEAVAVVQSLCASLPQDGEPRVPDLQDVLITAEGDVLIRRGSAAVVGLHELGRLLHALLDPAGTPVPLRLFVAHSTASERYESVGSFATALAVYARPDRHGLVQALYRRCINGGEAPPIEPQREASEKEKKKQQERRRRRFSRRLAVAAAFLVVLGGAVAAVWYWRAHPRVAAPVTAVRAAVSTAAAALQEGLSAILPATDPEPVVEAASESASPPVRRRTAPRPADETVASAEPVDAFGAGGDEIVEPVLVHGDQGVAPTAAVPVIARADVGRVYSAADEDVQPPVLYSPKLPPVALASPRTTGTNTMELIIDETGAVSRVRLVSELTRMADMTLLSAAKTWRFYPALKDGSPVPYRLSMSWSVTPP